MLAVARGKDSMRLEKLINELLVLLSAFALFFAACGDSATAPAGEKNADGNIADFGPVDNLPSCTENGEGNSATQLFSSSEMPRSSSSVKSSNSFAKSSSSNSAKSSSSFVKFSSGSVVNSSNSFVKFSSSSVAKSSSSSVKSSSSKGSSASSSLIEYGTLMDSRDGQTYKTVKIGNQWWMAQNLNYEASYGSYCYNLNTSNCTKYGRLYTWTSAMDTHLIVDGNRYGICPKGWHLPTQTEWNTLITAVGGESTAGMVLKSTSGWTGCENGTDAFGFSALPAGYRADVYRNEGDNAVFWSSTVYEDLPVYDVNDARAAYGVYLGYKYGDYAYMSFINETIALSVRCLKD